MKLKRHYDAASLADWQKGADAYIESSLAAARAANDIAAAAGTAERMSDKELRGELKQAYIGAQGLPTITHLSIENESKNDRWHPSQRLLDTGIAEGWLGIDRGFVTVTTADGQPDAVFRIVRRPGLYCVHCYAALATSKDAAKHVASMHADAELATLDANGKVPSGATQEVIDQINNPAGWGKFNHYVLERVRESAGS